MRLSTNVMNHTVPAFALPAEGIVLILPTRKGWTAELVSAPQRRVLSLLTKIL